MPSGKDFVELQQVHFLVFFGVIPGDDQLPFITSSSTDEMQHHDVVPFMDECLGVLIPLHQKPVDLHDQKFKGIVLQRQ